jgi:hypothetical protein
MVTPNVTEVPRALEPTTADPFIGRPDRPPADARDSDASQADTHTHTSKEPRHDE